MFQTEPATERDRSALMDLYTIQKGRPFCFWGEDYPSPENVEDDLARDALFVIRDSAGRPVAAVSIDRDEAVERLPCWNPRLAPAAEIARVAVHPDFQNQGLARRIVAYVMQVLKERGYRSMHLLVNVRNTPAIHAYSSFHFDQVGECDLYQQHFLCLETPL